MCVHMLLFIIPVSDSEQSWVSAGEQHSQLNFITLQEYLETQRKKNNENLSQLMAGAARPYLPVFKSSFFVSNIYQKAGRQDLGTKLYTCMYVEEA